MRNIFMLLSAVMGIFYYYLIQVDISKIEQNSFIINSQINQETKFHIQTIGKEASLICNDKEILFDSKTPHTYFYRGQEEIFIPLKRGENRCLSQNLAPKIAHKIGYIDSIVLFILVGIPIFNILFYMLISSIKLCKVMLLSSQKKDSIYYEGGLESITLQNIYIKLIWFILFAGVVVRIAYFQKYGIMVFQHDWHGHIAFIKHIAQNWTLPPIPTKSLEYPQQPLYYLITGGIYSLLQKIGFNSDDAIYGVGYFSLFCSIIFLYYSYLFSKLLTKNLWVQMVVTLFVSLTPSIVYLSARINNDSLVLLLSILALYYIIKSYQYSFDKNFYIALLATTLLFLTKISAFGVELLFFILLVIEYYKANYTQEKIIRKKLYLFSIVGIFLLCFTLLRVYLPLEEGFHMVNSAKFPKQTIESLDINYFLSFNIIELISKGYSYVFGEDNIRYSFLTYQYGTMFFGEADYSYFINRSSSLLITMQTILTLGLLYLIGFISYIIHLRHQSLLYKILFAILSINVILIIKFLWDYPSICNSDFRYFVPSFIILGVIFARGLEQIRSIKIVKWSIDIALLLLLCAELFFFYFLL